MLTLIQWISHLDLTPSQHVRHLTHSLSTTTSTPRRAAPSAIVPAPHTRLSHRGAHTTRIARAQARLPTGLYACPRPHSHATRVDLSFDPSAAPGSPWLLPAAIQSRSLSSGFRHRDGAATLQQQQSSQASTPHGPRSHEQHSSLLPPSAILLALRRAVVAPPPSSMLSSVSTSAALSHRRMFSYAASLAPRQRAPAVPANGGRSMSTERTEDKSAVQPSKMLQEIRRSNEALQRERLERLGAMKQRVEAVL